MWVYPGQNTPGIPEQVAAAAIKNIGRLDLFASALAVSQVVYHITPESPTGCGDAVKSEGRGPWENAVLVANTVTDNKNSFLNMIGKTGTGEDSFADFEL